MFFSPCPVLLLSWPGFAVSQALPQGWRFDVVSFAIGLLVAWLLVGLAYRYRARVARFRGRVQDQARRFRQRLTADMATRYSESVVEVAQRTHLLGTLATLDQIYVEMQLHALDAEFPGVAADFLKEGHLHEAEAARQQVMRGGGQGILQPDQAKRAVQVAPAGRLDRQHARARVAGLDAPLLHVFDLLADQAKTTAYFARKYFHVVHKHPLPVEFYSHRSSF